MLLPGINGYERQLAYSSRDIEIISARHHELAASHNISRPYWEVAAQGMPFILDQVLSTGARVQVGPIGAFGLEQLAIMFHEQPIIYVSERTMGDQYPMDNLQVNDCFISHMIGGVTADRIVVSLSRDIAGEQIPFAGVQAQLGENYPTIQAGLEDNTGALSSLGPSFALSPTESAKQSLPYTSFIEKYGDMTESSTWTLSRLFRRSNQELCAMGVSDRSLSCLCMALLGIGIERYPKSNKAEIVYYDANMPSLKDMLVKQFGTSQLLSEGQVQPTAKVLASELKYHYSAPREGGYLDKIVVGHAPINTYYNAAINLLATNWKLDI